LKELKKIWAFGIPYLKPYRFRFALGIFLSIFFGLSNGLFVVSINTLFNRLTPATSTVSTPVASVAPSAEPDSFDKKLKTFWKNIKII
jgi:hypothetical protein